MIAKLTYDDAEFGEQTLTLGDDAKWTGDDPDTVKSLNASLSAEDRSPARGNWLLAHAHRIAEMLEATIEVEEKDPPPPGTVY